MHARTKEQNKQTLEGAAVKVPRLPSRWPPSFPRSAWECILGRSASRLPRAPFMERVSEPIMTAGPITARVPYRV